MTVITDASNSAVPQVDDKPVFAEDKTNFSPDDFLKLFAAQLQNQNPMQPMDTNNMLQQMANLNSIQTANSMQKNMKDFQENMTSMISGSQFLSASQLVGKKVEIPSEQSPLTGDDKGPKELAGSVGVPKPAQNVHIVIKDPSGAIVKEIDCGPALTGGLVDFKWDGKDKDGNYLKNGFYKISGSALIDGVNQDVKTAGAFEVKSVALSPQEGVILNLDGMGGKSINSILKIM